MLIHSVQRSTGIIISKNTKISLFKILLASLIMGIIINQLIFLNIFILILVGIISYIASLFIMHILDEDEISMLKSIIDRGD